MSRARLLYLRREDDRIPSTRSAALVDAQTMIGHLTRQSAATAAPQQGPVVPEPEALVRWIWPYQIQVLNLVVPWPVWCPLGCAGGLAPRKASPRGSLLVGLASRKASPRGSTPRWPARNLGRPLGVEISGMGAWSGESPARLQVVEMSGTGAWSGESPARLQVA